MDSCQWAPKKLSKPKIHFSTLFHMDFQPCRLKEPENFVWDPRPLLSRLLSSCLKCRMGISGMNSECSSKSHVEAKPLLRLTLDKQACWEHRIFIVS